jgi:two-component system chemotaxis sensor kinase CheA
MELSQYKDMFCSEAREYIDLLGSSTVTFEKAPDSMDLLDEMFRAAHSLKGMAATMGISAMAELTHRLEDVFDGFRKNLIQPDSSKIGVVVEAINTLDLMLDEYDVTGDVSVDSDIIKAKLVGIARSSDIETKDATGKSGTGDLDNRAVHSNELAARGSSIVRIDVEKLDELVNLVGELVINRTSVLEAFKTKQGSPQEHALLEQLDRVTSDLQSAVMELRMVPIKEVFDRFPRMVRGLSEETGKRIDLHIKGEDTELDRSIVNRIGEPLVHLIRNAIDHGIESTDVRRAKGKPEEGNLTISAYHEGGYVIIAVEDDGAGISRDGVLRSAIEKRLIDDKQAKQMSGKEVLDLIFAPGFSTAQKITDVSGRGVGMDAVRDVVEELKGSVQVETEIGKGTKFLLRLPLTLSIIEAMMVEVGDEIYALPSEVVKENIIVQRKKMRRVDKGYVISNRDEIVPLVFLGTVLDNRRARSAEAQSFPVVIVDVNGAKSGLVVDRLLGQQEVVTKALGRFTGDIPGIAGATILGSGNVALILHVNSLVC